VNKIASTSTEITNIVQTLDDLVISLNAVCVFTADREGLRELIYPLISEAQGKVLRAWRML